MGERDHSWIQASFVAFFRNRLRETGIAVWPERRFQLKPTSFRVPDVILTKGKPEGTILREPPLLCMEILSPEDTISKTNQRIQEYLKFGVPVVWRVDPIERAIWVYRSNGMERAGGNSIKLDGTSIEVPFSEIFE